MSSWFIEPRDPLVIRDGRPNDRRSESATLSFPLPSTCAGICRTQLGSEPGRGFVLGAQLADLRRTSLRGPLLADRDAGGLLFPPPRDVRIERAHDGQLRARALSPVPTPDGVQHDDIEGLSLVGPAVDDARTAGKSARETAFWSWPAMERSLRAPLRLDGDADVNALLGDGVARLPMEARTHVALDPDTDTAREGQLFGTAGLRFAAGEPDSLSKVRPLALFVEFDASPIGGRAIRPGLAPFSGKRRLARWTPADTLQLPQIPSWLSEHVARAADGVSLRLRVILATPAIFRLGYRPAAGASSLLPAIAKLVAALVPRPETVSGWDFEHGRPKPSRRMVAAGSVFWIDLAGDAAARLAWLKGVWMQNVSDDEQDRRDGFGLALVGVGS
jgi:CRISPR-associated protein Cmr3